MGPKYLIPLEAAEYLRVAVSTLAKWRTSGFGPPYSYHGRRVVYDIAELDKWNTNQRVNSTSEIKLKSGKRKSIGCLITDIPIANERTPSDKQGSAIHPLGLV